MRGLHSTAEAPGAYPNGTRIVKTRMGEGDYHPIGAKGTVLGSMRPPADVAKEYPEVAYFYFVEWDDMPGLAVGVRSDKIGRA